MTRIGIRGKFGIFYLSLSAIAVFLVIRFQTPFSSEKCDAQWLEALHSDCVGHFSKHYVIFLAGGT